MDEQFHWQELVARKKYFHLNIEPLELNSELFYIQLQQLIDSIKTDLNKSNQLNREHALKLIFSQVYNFVINNDDDYSIFSENMVVYHDVFNACFFTSLCLFLHNTKRIKGLSLREFIYKHSPKEYNKKSSNYFFDIKKTYVKNGYDKRISYGNELIKNEETTLRQYRYRLYKARPVHVKKAEWSAISKDLEYEWSQYFTLENESIEVQQTFKRLKNLYSDIYKQINSPNDNNYEERLFLAYDKFLLKQKKIEYTKFLELHKVMLNHIYKDKHYYGINIYRFEKLCSFYNITNNVNQLLKCNQQDDIVNFLAKLITMNELYYPKLYEIFGNFNNINITKMYTYSFQPFMNDIVVPILLVIDDFIENGFLGEDWEEFLISTINNTVETVFYDPQKINYSVTSESQDKFLKVLSAPVYNLVLQKINSYKSNNH